MPSSELPWFPQLQAFQFHLPKLAQPVIPDDDDAPAFSHYILNNDDLQQTPPTPISFSSLSAPSSSYSELVSPLQPPSQPAKPLIPETEQKRPPGACTRCKKMKMKCVFLPTTDSACQRCKSGQFSCIVEGRKPRTPSQREYLLSQIRQKDALIATILKRNLSSNITPLTLATTKLPLSPAERAFHRDTLAWVDKGPSAAAGTGQRWRVPFREKERWSDRDGDKRADDPDEDDAWSSAGESEDAWDYEAEDTVREANIQIGNVYAHGLPAKNTPLGVIARLSLEDDRGTQRTKRVAVEADEQVQGQSSPTEEDEDKLWGVANPAYFQPGPAANMALRRVLNERESPAAIIASGLITWSEAEKLFQVFYEFINPFVSVLDSNIHTTSSVFERCPFLFTVVCAISLRYWTPPRAILPHPSSPTTVQNSPSSIYRLALQFVKKLAGSVLLDGPKTLEIVQAFQLLSVYGVPARRWEEDRTWFYGGMATRIALDLGLNKESAMHTRPMSERHGRELSNRVRTWLICFNVDRSSATQFGKPSAIWGPENEGIVRAAIAQKWYSGRYNVPYDLHLVMYVELLRIMSRFMEKVYKDGMIDKNCNFRAVTEATELELSAWHDDVTWRYENESDKNDPGSVFRTKGVPVFENYMKLVMYSFGFQDAWKRRERGRGMDPGGDVFFAKCLQAATTVIRHIVDVCAPSGYLKYAPDCYFVNGTFCAAFLLKLLRPEFSSLIDETQRMRMIGHITALAEVLGSPEVALDDAHTPKLYARFLRTQVGAIEEMWRVRNEARVELKESPPVSPSLLSGLSTSSISSPASSSSEPMHSYTFPSTSSLSLSSLSSSSSSCGYSSCSPVHEPVDQDQYQDRWTEMELEEEDYLASMRAVTSEAWLESVLMPGFKWEGGGGVALCDTEMGPIGSMGLGMGLAMEGIVGRD